MDMHVNATLWQSQYIFYMHQVPILIDYCTKYEQNQPILFHNIATATTQRPQRIGTDHRTTVGNLAEDYQRPPRIQRSQLVFTGHSPMCERVLNLHYTMDICSPCVLLYIFTPFQQHHGQNNCQLLLNDSHTFFIVQLIIKIFKL